LVLLDRDLDVLTERDQKFEPPIHGELPELPAQHVRNVGLPNSG